MPARHFDRTVLRAARRAADVTGVQLGKAVGVAQGQVSKWESGTTWPSPDKLPSIARALGKPLDELFPRDSAPDLADLRCDAEMTQAQAGALVGAAHVPINRAERGRQRLKPEWVPALASGYGVSEAELLAAQDRSFGVVPAAAEQQAPPTPQTTGEKINYLLSTTFPAGDAPDDAQLAASLNRAAGRRLADAADIAALRAGTVQLGDVTADPADEGALVDALAEVLGVDPLFFRSEQVVSDVMAGINLLASGGLALAARGAQGAGLSPAMVEKLSALVAEAQRENSAGS